MHVTQVPPQPDQAPGGREFVTPEVVNDGSAESGFESRSADLLAQYLGDTGLELERYAADLARVRAELKLDRDNPPLFLVPPGTSGEAA